MISPPARLSVTSRVNGTTYHVTVAPPNPGLQPGPWPVLLVLDGDDQFPDLLNAYRGACARGGGRPLLLAGVGYGASYRQPANRRVRDYTPTALATEKDSGGAEAFHAFLVDELWPRLAREYPVLPGQSALAGHSLGALFVLHALFRPQPFFRRALASAPSLWWDDCALSAAVRDFRARQDRLDGHLWLGIGEEDTQSMRGDLAAFQRQLRDQPFEGLRVTSQRFAGHDHYSVLPVAYQAGLQALYG